MYLKTQKFLNNLISETLRPGTLRPHSDGSSEFYLGTTGIYFSYVTIIRVKFFTEKRFQSLVDEQCLVLSHITKFPVYKLTFKGLWFATNDIQHIKTVGR